MRLTEVVETVTVQEATIGEIRRWLAGLSVGTPMPLIDTLPFGGMAPSELRMFVDPDQHADLDALTPSETARVVEAVQRINPDFFQLRALIFPGAATPEPMPAPDSTVSSDAPLT